jgi:hypothetical protein
LTPPPRSRVRAFKPTSGAIRRADVLIEVAPPPPGQPR